MKGFEMNRMLFWGNSNGECTVVCVQISDVDYPVLQKSYIGESFKGTIRDVKEWLRVRRPWFLECSWFDEELDWQNGGMREWCKNNNVDLPWYKTENLCVCWVSYSR
jgi:hypothetical protein